MIDYKPNLAFTSEFGLSTALWFGLAGLSTSISMDMVVFLSVLVLWIESFRYKSPCAPHHRLVCRVLLVLSVSVLVADGYIKFGNPPVDFLIGVSDLATLFPATRAVLERIHAAGDNTTSRLYAQSIACAMILSFAALAYLSFHWRDYVDQARRAVLSHYPKRSVASSVLFHFLAGGVVLCVTIFVDGSGSEGGPWPRNAPPPWLISIGTVMAVSILASSSLLYWVRRKPISNEERAVLLAGWKDRDWDQLT